MTGKEKTYCYIYLDSEVSSAYVAFIRNTERWQVEKRPIVIFTWILRYLQHMLPL